MGLNNSRDFQPASSLALRAVDFDWNDVVLSIFLLAPVQARNTLALFNSESGQ